MSEQKQWVASHGIYHYSEIPQVYPQLPPAVYELQFDNFSGSFVLQKIYDHFELPEVMYDLEDALIDRVLKTFSSHNKNFGILLKGLKGTGKTIAAKIICNKLKLPVILVTKPWNDMASFIGGIEQDVILFFDEFEKLYNFYERFDSPMDANEEGNNGQGVKDVSNLLTLMDGVFTSKYKRLFLLTTNKDYLPDAMIARPSRIRYIKDFTDLSLDIILQILKDTVVNKDLIPGLINILKNLEIITVDIVKAVAEEANLYNTDDPEFFEIFNVKRIHNHYDFFEINAKGEERVIIDNQVYDLARLRKGHNLYDGESEYIGTVVKHDPEEKTVIVVDARNDGKKSRKERTIYYRKSVTPHYAFSHYMDV